MRPSVRLGAEDRRHAPVWQRALAQERLRECEVLGRERLDLCALPAALRRTALSSEVNTDDGDGLQTFPAAATALDLRRCSLRCMPAMPHGSALSRVDLSRNMLRGALPAGAIAALPLLESLDVSRNLLTDLPWDALAVLPALRVLRASRNVLTTALETDTLMRFVLVRRRSTSTPSLDTSGDGDGAGSSSSSSSGSAAPPPAAAKFREPTDMPHGGSGHAVFRALEELDLSHNRITEVPRAALGKMYLLARLSVRGNPLGARGAPPLPPLLGAPRLCRIDAADTAMQLVGPGALFAAVGVRTPSLRSVTHLDLSRNRLLTRLPPSLWTMRSLRRLAAAECGLVVVDPGISALASTLEHVDLSGNPTLQDLPWAELLAMPQCLASQQAIARAAGGGPCRVDAATASVATLIEAVRDLVSLGCCSNSDSDSGAPLLRAGPRVRGGESGDGAVRGPGGAIPGTTVQHPRGLWPNDALLADGKVPEAWAVESLRSSTAPDTLEGRSVRYKYVEPVAIVEPVDSQGQGQGRAAARSKTAGRSRDGDAARGGRSKNCGNTQNTTSITTKPAAAADAAPKRVVVLSMTNLGAARPRSAGFAVLGHEHRSGASAHSGSTRPPQRRRTPEEARNAARALTAARHTIRIRSAVAHQLRR
jgi:Leucine-rich repeat (LRR) protein